MAVFSPPASSREGKLPKLFFATRSLFRGPCITEFLLRRPARFPIGRLFFSKWGFFYLVWIVYLGWDSCLPLYPPIRLMTSRPVPLSFLLYTRLFPPLHPSAFRVFWGQFEECHFSSHSVPDPLYLIVYLLSKILSTVLSVSVAFLLIFSPSLRGPRRDVAAAPSDVEVFLSN